MANLNKFSNKNFQCESVNELMKFSNGVTLLFQGLVARWNYEPSLTSEDFHSLEIVLDLQLEAQIELGKRFKDLSPKGFDFDNRHDILD